MDASKLISNSVTCPKCGAAPRVPCYKNGGWHMARNDPAWEQLTAARALVASFGA